MPVAYESDGGGIFCAAANNNAVTVPLPATRPVGSVLLLVAYCRLITATVATAPSGYTLLQTWTSGTASGGRIWLYGRVCDGSESAPTFACGGAVTGTSGDLWAVGITCYSGVDTSGGISAIFDGTPTVQDASGTTTCTYPALTISQSNSMIVRLLARFRDAADTFTPTATWNERADLGSTTRTGGQFHSQDKLATSSGSQAAVTVAPSNTTAARYLAVTLALKAVAATNWTQPVNDTLALANSTGTERGIAHSIANSFLLANLPSSQSDIARAVADTLTLGDALASQGVFQRTIANTLALADLLGSARAIFRAVTDTLSPANAIAFQSALLRTLANTVVLADQASPVKGAAGIAWAQPIPNTLAVANALSSQAAFLRGLANTLTLDDQANPVLTIGVDHSQAISDALTLANTLDAEARRVRVYVEKHPYKNGKPRKVVR